MTMYSSHLMKPIHLMTFNESANGGDYESAAADESAHNYGAQSFIVRIFVHGTVIPLGYFGEII